MGKHQEVWLSDGDERLLCKGYCRVAWKVILFHTFAILFGGIPYLFAYWYKAWGIRQQCVAAPLDQADYVILKNSHNEHHVCKVHSDRVTDMFPEQYRTKSAIDSLHENVALLSSDDYIFRYFVHRQLKYGWNAHNQSFEQLHGLSGNITCAGLLECHGISELEQTVRLQLYGPNSILVEVKSYLRLFFEEGINPFYFFQVFSIVLWSCDDYIYYAACILVISVISLAVTVREIRKQSESLQEMVMSSESSTVSVLRLSGSSSLEKAENVVPGDIIEIPPVGCVMPCDAVLLAGTCIVNESMLTGESVPVMKTPLQSSDEIYIPDSQKRHTIFAGTHVIQTRYYRGEKVCAVVVRTGFNTTKGDLVRAILFPKPMSFKFYKDSMRFVLFLFAIAIFGMGYCLYLYILRGSDWSVILKRTLDIVTIVVPPALPAALTVGTSYAQSRLKKKGIFCISPNRINVCGKLKLICFDKTGTLTEDGLDLTTVVPCENATFTEPIQPPFNEFSDNMKMLTAMATCHSLTQIDGNITGDPLDIKMFEATKWVLEEPGQDNTKYDMIVPTIVKPVNSGSSLLGDDDFAVPLEVGVVRQFPFSSTLQRMSVITRTLGQPNMELYSKGSPEQILLLCKKETVPEQFGKLLNSYTVKGYRVIAVAYSPFSRKFTWHQANRIKRDQVECNLTFLGLLVMKNTLKPETTPVIDKLNAANIRSVMVTGDNILTAISVARECRMVAPEDKVIIINANPPDTTQSATIDYECSEMPSDDQEQCVLPMEDSLNYRFAVSGKSWGVIRKHFPDLLPYVLIQGAVFARMSPDQKAQLVESLQELDYVVGMCGDGANDCGALKSAEVGISLSEAEASVAAPFTSKVPNITCVPDIISEGRCALVTSFSLFKYVALYSMVQFMSVLLLYTKFSNFGDVQFLYIDLFILTTLAVAMGRTASYNRLVPERPAGNLVSAQNISSILLQIIIAFLFQFGSLLHLIRQEWYHPVSSLPDGEAEEYCWENTVIFAISSYQYLSLAVVFSRGRPFRKPLYTNVPFLLSLIILTGFTTLLVTFPGKALSTFFQLKDFPNHDVVFHAILLLTVALNFLISFLVENYVTRSHQAKNLFHAIVRKKEPKNRFKRISNELAHLSWPFAEDPQVPPNQL